VILAVLRVFREIGVFFILSFVMIVLLSGVSHETGDFSLTNKILAGLMVGLLLVAVPWLAYGWAHPVRRARLRFLVRWNLPMMLAISLMPAGHY
jgi:hypothetical protein